MSYLPKQQPKSIFNELQHAYSNEDGKINMQHLHNKHNYYRVAQLENARRSEAKKMERAMKNHQNQRLKDIWQYNDQLHAQQQRRKRAQIDNVRKANQNMSLQIMSKKTKDDYQPYGDYSQYYNHQFEKQRRQRQEFYKQAVDYHEIRKEKERNQKIMDKQIFRQKELQQRQLVNKRQAELQRIRGKHQQNADAYYQLDDALRQKKKQQQKLESLIVNKGASDQQAKMFELRAEFQARERDRKNSYIRDLKTQLNQDSYRQNSNRVSQILDDRKKIQQRNRYFSMVDEMERAKKIDESKQTREILKDQMKPRVLKQQSDRMQKVGIGSPANIGKVIGDDRKRQLEWIQKSLLKQIQY